MKIRLLLAMFAAVPWMLQAHDHLEIGLNAPAGNRLAVIAGPSQQLMTFFPGGEAPSYDTSSFPGNAFASILTFSAFDSASPPPLGAFVRIEVLAVNGPAGGSFSFWEAGATTPSWKKPSGWTAQSSDKPGLDASEDGTGYGHIHGRVFSADKPGDYDVTFQAVDTTQNYLPSNPFVIRFSAVEPPALGITCQRNTLTLSFTSRPNLVYDLQSSTTLAPQSWTTITTLDGTGGQITYSDPMNGRPRVFYRIVEYQ